MVSTTTEFGVYGQPLCHTALAVNRHLLFVGCAAQSRWAATGWSFARGMRAPFTTSVADDTTYVAVQSMCAPAGRLSETSRPRDLPSLAATYIRSYASSGNTETSVVTLRNRGRMSVSAR